MLGYTRIAMRVARYLSRAQRCVANHSLRIERRHEAIGAACSWRGSADNAQERVVISRDARPADRRRGLNEQHGRSAGEPAAPAGAAPGSPLARHQEHQKSPAVAAVTVMKIG